MTTRAMEVRRLILTVWGGLGSRSNPLGELQEVEVAFSSPGSGVLAFALTFDLHLLRLLAGPQDQLRAIKETVDDIHVSSYAIVHHLLFAAMAQNNQDGRFTSLGLAADLQESLLTVVEDTDWLDGFVFALDLVVETQ